MSTVPLVGPLSRNCGTHDECPTALRERHNKPRDRDPRASWALYDGDSVSFRRVSYEITRTQAAIRQLPVSENSRDFFSDRLGRGE